MCLVRKIHLYMYVVVRVYVLNSVFYIDFNHGCLKFSFQTMASNLRRRSCVGVLLVKCTSLFLEL